MITITVVDGFLTTSYTVKWHEGMNGLGAMEALHTSKKEFTYALAGDNFITMINGKYESIDPLVSPYYYWEII